MLFDKILYINLSRRPDRNEHIIRSLKYLNLLNNAERVDAVDGKLLLQEEISPSLITSEGLVDAYNKDLRVYEPLTQGGIGCALSHKKIYEKIVDEQIEKCFILEDDAKFDVDFYKKISEIEENVPKVYDMLFFGYHVSMIKNDVNAYCFKPDKVYGLFGYIVTLEGAKKLLDMFPLTYQIDTEISNNMANFDAYCVKPEYHIIYSDRSSTTTQFGTDIQIREEFGNIIIANIILFFILVLVILAFLLSASRLGKKLNL